MAQVSAAALVSESKSLSFPASVDSIPTNLLQEDHVSMGPIAGMKARIGFWRMSAACWPSKTRYGLPSHRSPAAATPVPQNCQSAQSHSRIRRSVGEGPPTDPRYRTDRGTDSRSKAPAPLNVLWAVPNSSGCAG